MGIDKCKRRARDILYWPNMNQYIYDTVSQCDVCQEYIYAQPQQPLQMHERPYRPWAKVACDSFYLKQVPYLLTVDYYSHYPEIALLTNESSRQVISHLKSQGTGSPRVASRTAVLSLPVPSSSSLLKTGESSISCRVCTIRGRTD